MMTSNRTIMTLFVPILLAINLVFIPFHAGDDENRFAVAYTLAHLEIGPVSSSNPSLSSGGYVDAAIPIVIAQNWRSVRLAPSSPPVVRTDTAWTGRDVFMPLPDTAYLPLLFAPQAVLIRIGELAGWSVQQTIFAARLANGAFALALISISLTYLPQGVGGFVLAILALPKSLQLFASNSADPMMYAVTIALMAFYCSAIATDWRPKAWHYALAGIGVVALGGGRPPLTAFGLLVAYVAFRKRDRIGSLIAAISIALPFVWWASVLPLLHDTTCATAGSVGEKLGSFLSHAPQLVGQTISERAPYYWITFIGELGYGNALVGYAQILPLWIYLPTTAILFFGLSMSGAESYSMSIMDRASPALASAAALTGIFFSFVMACNAMDAPVIRGIQGRYFTAPLLVAVLAIAPSLPSMMLLPKIYRSVLVAFLLVSFYIMLNEGLRLYWL